MSEAGQSSKRFPVQYFDGVNSTVQPSLAKRTELSHMENARSPKIGVLEKREGQVVKGTLPAAAPFVATENHGLVYFNNEQADNLGVFRISKTGATLDMYYLHTNNEWTKLVDTEALALSSAPFSFTNADKNLIIVNGTDENRYLGADGTTVIDATQAGNLYNSPPANKTVYYKNRIHLADFTRNAIRYPTTILRSSLPLGVISLVDGDHLAGVTELRVTDSKYFYSDAGVNSYEIYRGGTLIETVTVSAVNELTVTVGATGNAINSSDEIWIAGTFAGDKQFRWVNNPTTTGRDVKQYDTFKLTGGDGSPITLFETIGNVLMIGNGSNLATWDDYNLTQLDLGIGCASSRGYTKLLGTLYFLDYSGIYGTTGGLPTLLSRKVERYISGATKEGLEACTAGVKGLSTFFTIGDVTLYNPDGSVEIELSDVALEYSVADQNWYVHTNVVFDDFINYKDANGDEQLWGTQTTANLATAAFLEGNTDNGSEIFFRVDTQEIQLMKEFEIYAQPLNIHTEMDRGSQAAVFISLDRERFYELEGNAEKGVSLLKVHKQGKDQQSPPHCRKVRLSYRDSSRQRCRLTQFAIDYLPTTKIEPHE